MIAGLGNPGPRYERTRHNIGFRVVDELARRHLAGGSFRRKHGAEVAICPLFSADALLIKPMEFMNRSGDAVQRAAAFYKVSPAQMIVVHDEIDLAPGRLRVKLAGGHGGHNGLRSIMSQLGSGDFARVRVGIGKPEKASGGAGEGAVSSYVLADFPAAERAEVDALVARAADATETIARRGIRDAMNDFNGVS